MTNGTEVVLSLQVGTTTNYRTILYGTADNFQLTTKDVEITSKQSGAFDEFMAVSHGGSFDVSYIFDSATSTTYYDAKALLDLEITKAPVAVKFGKTGGLGVTCSAIITGHSLDANLNDKISGKVSLKTTGTITPTATLA